MSELNSKDYWNKRAVDMKRDGVYRVMADVKAPSHEEKVKEFLKQWRDLDVLDVGCGYGRFSEGMNHYEGFDFSEEMVKQANNQNIWVDDAHREFGEQWDVVFGVIVLSSLEMTPEEFYNKWKGNARKYVAVFELDRFYIFPIYEARYNK